MADAWGARAVRFGFVGSVCILIGTLSPAYLPQASPVWTVLNQLRWGGTVFKVLGTVFTMVGLGLLMETWLRLRPARRRALGRPQLRHWAVLAIIASPLLIAPPVFSHDAYSYAAQGWMLHNGINPYEVGPSVLPGYFADQVAWVWRDTTAPYGPLALKMSHALVVVAGFDPLASTLLMRLPAMVGVLLIGWCTPRIARSAGVDPSAASWFVMCNPILIIDFVGGMHNDALMTGLMVLGIWLTIQRKQWWLGALVVGVAATIKQPALLAAVVLPFLVVPLPQWRPALAVVRSALRVAASVALAVGTFAAISVATGLGFGWIGAIDVPGSVATVSPFTVVGHMVQWVVDLAGLDPSGVAAVNASRTLGVAVFAVGTVWLAIRHLGQRPLHFLSWSFLLFAFCAPALHSWYVLWGGVLFPMTKPSPRWLRVAVVVTAVLLSYSAMNFALRNGFWLLAVLLMFAVWESIRGHALKQRWELVSGRRGSSVS
ncbi:MAG: polyprenol phosphomannose-dependent alpha 1,6 mannosyltransferase MptB [Propionibacteriaceae bacterium]|nr:polyprenol phosphomannose-dependent alpha 1,6 mannosyltransferase MptB [Propionibacteriaceae bacterium]